MQVKDIFWAIIVVLIGGMTIKSCNDKRVAKNELELLKNQALEQKKVILKEDTKVKKDGFDVHHAWVKDTLKYKELLRLASERNQELVDIIKEKDEKILIYGQTIMKLKEQESKVLPNINNEFQLKYPSEDRWFISYKGVANSVSHVDSITGKWLTNPIPLDLSVTEVTPGLYKAYIRSYPEFEFSKIDVLSLPITNLGEEVGIGETRKRRDKNSWLGWKIGAGWYRSFPTDGSPTKDGIEFMGGPTLGRWDIHLRVQPFGNTVTPSQVGAGLLYNL